MKYKTFDKIWEELKNESPEIKAELKEAEKNSELMMDITAAVRNLLDEKDSEKWIDADFAEPNSTRRVLVYDKNIGILIGFFTDGWCANGFDDLEVTHWRELPVKALKRS